MSSHRTFVPIEFSPPEGFRNDHFQLRMLTIGDVIKDYDAVMSSVDHLQGCFGPDSAWPSAELTLEQNLIDLGWHQKEFQRRTSFAYTVESLDKTRILGCVYIYPADKEHFDAFTIMWVRKLAYDQGMDPILFNCVKQWIDQSWPFSTVGYPGREISWETWSNMD